MTTKNYVMSLQSESTKQKVDLSRIPPNTTMKKKREDDSLDYLHSSPPTKSRRLDSEVPMEMMEEDVHTNVNVNIVPPNEERSLVLYQPSNSSNTPLLKSPSSPPFTIVVNTNLIPGLKDYLLSRGTTKLDELGEDEMRREKTSEVSKDCLAVMPWVPKICEEIIPETCQTLESEDSEMMEMDEPYANNNNEKVETCGVSSPWQQQQQCMMPNLLKPQSGMNISSMTCNKKQTCVDTTEIFSSTQRFATREETIKWIREVGIRNRVTVIITRSNIKTDKRGRSGKVIFGCDRGGKYKEGDNETQSASKKCGCPFKIRSTPSKNGSGWKIDVKCGLHNHELPDTFEGQRNSDEHHHIVDLTKHHVPSRHVILSLQERDIENVTRITQIYKQKSKLQKDIRGPRTEMQHLFNFIEDSDYVYWSRKKDESEGLRDIFWAHPESVKLLNMFPIVLIMDNTYKTNKYKQPLFEVVGMTSTEVTFTAAFAYMEFEQTENFCWVLDKLKQLFTKQEFWPQVILTNNDLALMKAIEIVFPKTINLLCRFHINKNVKSKCKEYVVDDMQEPIEKIWCELIRASDEVEYHQRLQQFEHACVDFKAFIDYVKDIWLTPHKHRFVEAWITQVFHLGNTTTNRVESAHWKLKQMLKNNLGDMSKCWETMNDNLKIQLGNIKASFQKSFYEVEHAHTSPFYRNLRGSISRVALRHIAEECARVDIVGTNTQKCGCTRRRVYGLPCACELGRYTLNGDPIPIEAIHIHWRKLHMKDKQEVNANDVLEVDMTNAIDAIWKKFRSLDVVGKRALKSRVCEIAYPTTTRMGPTPEKIKIKGGVKKKEKKPVGYDVYRDPSYHEYADQAHKSSQKSSQRTCSHLSQTSKKKPPSDFIVQFPEFIRPFIDDIVDVKKDGNCGFRVIASLHGYGTDGWPIVRRDLDNEIRGLRSNLYEQLFGDRLSIVRESLMISSLGQQPPEKWMTLPDMGYVIANRYNVIVVSLGYPSLTFFPMTTSHSPNVSIYCIGYVDGNHWVQVNMKEGFPLPPVTLDWKKFRTRDATSWMISFTLQLQNWLGFTPIVPRYIRH